MDITQRIQTLTSAFQSLMRIQLSIADPSNLTRSTYDIGAQLRAVEEISNLGILERDIESCLSRLPYSADEPLDKDRLLQDLTNWFEVCWT